MFVCASVSVCARASVGVRDGVEIDKFYREHTYVRKKIDKFYLERHVYVYI